MDPTCKPFVDAAIKYLELLEKKFSGTLPADVKTNMPTLKTALSNGELMRASAQARSLKGMIDTAVPRPPNAALLKGILNDVITAIGDAINCSEKVVAA